MWMVDPDSPDWLQRPHIGKFSMVNPTLLSHGVSSNIQQSLDWKVIDRSMYMFNRRNAFCLYEKNMRMFRLFDAERNTCSQVNLDSELRCAVIGSHDDQIFYVRLHDHGGGFLSKAPPLMGLYRRPIQGARIGLEFLITRLPKFTSKATFDIACREEDSAQVLVIVSTEGNYQSIRLESGEDNGSV